MKVLITGGAGYIGSTICSAMEDNGHTPIILDSLLKGKEEFTQKRIFYKGDISDEKLLEKIFREHKDIECAIHCAALIVVPESMEKPYEYYTENVVKSLKLFKKLNELNCNKIVFSSSASIYDDIESFMVTEKDSLNPRSPYARTKAMVEMILEDFCNAYGMKGISLRYFNVIGADPKMRSGAYIRNPSHVLARIMKVANGEEKVFEITGTNWSTKDGSGIRDYIHVWDLAQAHVCAVENIDKAFEKTKENGSYIPINLGTGMGITVKELVEIFEKVYDRGKINVVESESRPGDVAGAYANTDLAKNLIGWSAKLTVEDGIRHAIQWERSDKGYL